MTTLGLGGTETFNRLAKVTLLNAQTSIVRTRISRLR